MGRMKLPGAIIIAAFVVVVGVSSTIAQDSALVADIESMISLGEKVHPSFAESIRDRIKANPAVVVQALLPKIEDTAAEEKNLAVYVWALGFTKDPNAADGIIALCDKTESDLVGSNCLNALAAIGDEKSGAYIFAALDKTEGENERFEILNLLAQMQYEPALPVAMQIMEVYFKQFYWKPIFIFGKYGDMDVPMLM